MNELATYAIEFSIDGLQVPGAPAGAGDRKLRFELKIDATDPEAADKVWYGHLEALLGPDEIEKLRETARQMRTRR